MTGRPRLDAGGAYGSKPRAFVYGRDIVFGAKRWTLLEAPEEVKERPGTYTATAMNEEGIRVTVVLPAPLVLAWNMANPHR